MKPQLLVASLVALKLFLVACAPSASPSKPEPPPVDVAKFEATYRSVKATQGALAVGVDHATFRALLQTLATEISIAQDKAITPEEQKVLSEYRVVLDIYKDSLAIWDRDITSHDYRKGVAGLPEDEIHVNEDLAPLVARYNLSTESRTQADSGHKYRVIAANSKQLLWNLVEQQMATLGKAQTAAQR